MKNYCKVLKGLVVFFIQSDFKMDCNIVTIQGFIEFQYNIFDEIIDNFLFLSESGYGREMYKLIFIFFNDFSIILNSMQSFIIFIQ